MTTYDVLLRMGLAFVAGMILGLERETHGRAAGLRTTTLACMAACLAMILAQFFIHDPAFKNMNWKPDPGRLAAGILTGIGFLGAGAIVRDGTHVRGVTTAAVLWHVTILGLVFGSGYITLGLIGACMALVALFGLTYVEQHVQRENHAEVCVTIQLGGVAESEIRECIKTLKVTVRSVSLDYDLQQRQRKFRYMIRYRKESPLDVAQKVIEKLTDLPGVTRVEWQ